MLIFAEPALPSERVGCLRRWLVQVFDARCVIKICMNDQVREAALRLLDNADVIKKVVDLRGACIALDDCYEVRDVPEQSRCGIELGLGWRGAT